MNKRKKNIIYSDVFEDIDLEVAAILRKCDDGKKYDSLPQQKKDKLWNSIFNLINLNNTKEAKEENSKIIKVTLEVLLSIIGFSQGNLEGTKSLIDVIKYVNSGDFVISEPIIMNSLSKLNEYWMTKVQKEVEIPGMEYFTLKHLLTLCTADKLVALDIQRLSAIRKVMTATPFEKMVPSLKSLLFKVIESTSVLNSENGQKFIAYSLILSHKLMMDIHKTIMLDLEVCNKKKAEDYGKIYMIAWNGASDEIKLNLQKFCFQILIEKFMKEHRTSLELCKTSQNILAILKVWHSEKSRKNQEFFTMITNAHQPILWKYLQSGFNMHRCNAADVLFKAFPLYRFNDDVVEAEKLFSMQYEAMLACLSDDCHIVRIIAIREVCNIVSHYWNSFKAGQIQNLLKVIAKENASDSSTAEVRRMVYIGFQSLVKSPLSCQYIKQILPLLANNIHDVNQKVRIAFIQLLNCIKERKDPNFKYSDIVSMSNIQYRLADDNAIVGQWIVKLLINNYYTPKMSVLEWTKRFIYLIKTYKHSYRNFFFYSGKSLSFCDACTIIYEILSQLGMFVLSKYDSDKEDSENCIKEPLGKKKCTKKNPLSDSNGRQSSPESNGRNIQKKCAFDEPEVISGLFDVVTILWVLNDIQLNKPENEEMRFKLYDTYIKYAQPFINYYKNSDIIWGVISLSGNIPASLLRNNSITLPGYCIKILRSINMEKEDVDREKIVCVLMALVKWGKGSEIIEQVALWLDAAFETQNMNETILPRRRVKISDTIQPNSVVAIYILDTLLKKEYAKLSVLKKNYMEIFQLWKFMSRIKQLIENRLEQEEPFEEELVSDHFLTLCFRRYVKMIPLLREEENCEENEDKNSISSEKAVDVEGFINRQKEIENILEWANHLFYPLLEQKDLDENELNFIVTLLEDILYVSDNMIIIHSVNHQFQFKVGHFVLKLLENRHAIRFVKSSTRIISALNYSAKLLFNVSDDLKIFSTVIPSLVCHTLNALTIHKFTSEEMKRIEEDMPVIKLNLGKILATYQDNLKQSDNLKEKARQLKMMISFFVDCIVSMVAKNLPQIGEEFDQMPEYSSPADLPPVANVLICLFHNKKTWALLFIHLLNATLTTDEEVKNVFASLLLLRMYAMSDKKLNKDELKKTLAILKKKFTEMKKSLSNSVERVIDSLAMRENRSCNESNSDSNTLHQKSMTSNENTSKEVLISNKEPLDQTNNSSNISNFEKYSDEYFINYGFELLDDIDKVLKSQEVMDDENP